MTGWLRPALHLASKDLRVELRTRDVLTAVGLFALLVVVVASFSFPTFGEGREQIAAGMLWMAFLFAILLGVGRTIAMEHEDACLDALVASPVPRESIFLGKVLSNLAFTGTAVLLLLPIASVLLQLHAGQAVVLLVVTALLGTLALVSLGTLFAAMAVNTRTREAILPVLVVPLAIPVMIAAVKASEVALEGGSFADAASWLFLLGGSGALFLLIGLAVFPYILEE